VNSHTKINITCPEHGEFPQTPNSHLNGNGCPSCKAQKTSDRCRQTRDWFIQKAINTHGDKYIYDDVDYQGDRVKVKIGCRSHGIFEQTPNNHFTGQGCPVCKYEKIASLLKNDRESFINNSLAIHGERFDYSLVDYTNARTDVEIICGEHGSFWQKPNNHLSGQGCPVCKSSRGEEVIRLILEKHSIEFEREYMIPGATPRYRYDFYLPYYNLFIEFHGIQHYKPVEMFGGEEAYKDTVQRDTFKKAIARMMRIKLVSFSYLQLKQLTQEQFEEIILRRIYNSAKLYTA
jgi:hypothetical protein